MTGDKKQIYNLARKSYLVAKAIPDAKNHGMMMFIDWSGSMSDKLTATIHQLMNLTMFCKKVQIPFEVYAFTDRNHRWEGTTKSTWLYKSNDKVMDNFNLLQLFSSDMKKVEFVGP